MNDDLIKCYELLGVSPGVSIQELKTAHRDLAKVWHPDRFAHDPRLQQKAQEKLKEINEAYDQLSSAKTGSRKPVATAPSSAKPSAAPEESPSRSARRTLLALPALILALLFFAAYQILIPANKPAATTSPSRMAEETQALPGEATQPSDAANRPRATDSPRGRRAEESVAVEKGSRTTSVAAEQEARQRTPLPTVTVTIDPLSGMLAKSDCPAKSKMTYPQGSEPGQYCNLSHSSSASTQQTEEARPKESRLKSFARRLGAPAKLLGGKEASDRNP